MKAGRSYDALYDTSYQVSGARDHYKEQNKHAGVVMERVPEYSNMFSKLPHHPSTTYRFKANNHIPGFVNREYVEQSPTPGELAAISTKGTVSGENRFKYHKRPLLGSASAVPQSMTVGTLSPAPVGEGQRSRTVATQSVYRESEAQTLPYSPDYVLPDQTSDKQRALMDKYHTDIPEVLTLQKMKFGQGLPIGLAELNRIDKLREKRAFEAQLPPLHDLEQLPRRKAMMEAWEHKEWAEREEEIRRLQEERLELLARAIEQREENIEAIAVERVETIKAREFAKRDQVFAAIQKRRIKAVRQLTHARSKTDTTMVKKKTIIQKYGDFGSDVYAPLQRDGRFPDVKPQGKDIDPEPFVPRTLNSLYDLENSVPASKFEVKVKGPDSKKRMDAAARKDAAVSDDLNRINGLLETTKNQGGRGFGDCWPYPLATDAKIKKDKRQRTIIDRPVTPVAPPMPQDAARHAAATLLQRLLRGRAVQNIMYEGKNRRLELIKELRMEEDAVAREQEMLKRSQQIAKEVGRPESAPTSLPMPGVLQVRDAMMDEVIGATMMETLAILAMEPGDKQTAALKELLARYPPPTADTANDLSREEAATKIQSVFRGHKARRETKQIANMRGRGADLREKMSAQEAADVEVQAQAHGTLTQTKTQNTSKAGKTSTSTSSTKTTTVSKVTRLSLKVEEDDVEMIIKVQAQSRGYLSRRRFKEMQKAAAEAPASPDLDNYSAEDQEKITKIQAQGRGYIARKRVDAMRKPGPDADTRPPAAGAAERSPGAAGGVAEGSSNAKSAVKAASLPATEKDPARPPGAGGGPGDASAAVEGTRGTSGTPQDPGAAPFDLSKLSEEEQRKIVQIQAQGRGYITRKHVKERRDEAAGKASQQTTLATSASKTEGAHGDSGAGEGPTEAQAAAEPEANAAAENTEAEKPPAAGAPAAEQVSDNVEFLDAEQPAEVAAVEAPVVEEPADVSDAVVATPRGDPTDLSSFSDEDQRKIVQLQAQGRGYIARKHMKEQKESTTHSSSTVHESESRSEFHQSTSRTSVEKREMHHSVSTTSVETSSNIMQQSSTKTSSTTVKSSTTVQQSSTVVQEISSTAETTSRASVSERISTSEPAS